MKKQIRLNISRQSHYQQDAFQQFDGKWIWNKTQAKIQVPNLYSRSRIMQGSTPHLKIIISIKEFKSSADSKSAFYIGIFLVNLDYLSFKDPKSKLLFYRNFYMGDEQQISDVVVHPNGKQVLIFQQKKILKYSILTKKTGHYDFNSLANVSLETSYNFSNVQYHPSGQFVIGLLSDNPDKDNAKLFKFTHKTMKFVKIDAFDHCIIDSSRDFPRSFQSWNIAIDQDSGNSAMSVFGSQFCIINTTTLQQTKINKQGYLPIIPTIYKNLTLNQSTKDPNKKMKSINYIELDRNKYFLTHNYDAQINQNTSVVSQRFDIQQGKFVDNMLLIGIVPGLKDNLSIAQKIKCIQMDNINGIACISQINNTIYFSQWDKQNNVTYALLELSLNKIRTTKKSYNIQIIEIEIVNSSAIIEDITYYQPANEVCYLYNGTLTCLQTQFKCSENSTSPDIIRNCRQPCRDKSTFWNPISLSCQACAVSNCTCASKQQFNQNLNRCVLSCSQIARAVQNSEYDNYTKCVCEAPFTWFQDLKICRYNCSMIQNINPTLNYSNLNISLCKCRQSYRFIQKLGTIDEQFGMCSLESCPKNTREVKINNLLTCECDTEKGFRMGRFQQDCIYETKQSGIPGWSIFLIALLSIVILGVIGFFIWRKWKKSKKDKEDEGYGPYKEPGSPASNLQTKYNQKNEQRISSQRMSQRMLEMKQRQRICQICQNTEQKTNCQSPCQHYFHFQCILDNKNDEQKIQCPSCSRQFQLKQITMKETDSEFAID